MKYKDGIKVLWFTNTPANADEYLDSELVGTGGWLKALDLELQRKVNLSIAFYGKDNSEFNYGLTRYYSIKNKRSIFNRISERLNGKILDEEHLDIYLNIIKKVNPDVIHIHGTENSFGCIISNINIPVVVSIQGNITVYYNKFLSGFNYKYLRYGILRNNGISNIFSYYNFKSQYNRFRNMQFREQKNLKNTEFVIGRTDWDRRILKVLAPHCEYFYNSELLRPIFYEQVWEYSRFNQRYVLFTTNGNTIYKGFETLCQSLNFLNKLGVDCEWRVAGISEKDLILKITKMKLGMNFPNKGLKLLGNLNASEIMDNMKDSNIYVMPSHIENSPNNLSEAMLFGLPCVATFVGGVGSLVKDKIDGLLVQSGDPWAMTGAILEILENRDLAKSLGNNAREAALLRHNKDAVINDLIEIYIKIIRKKNGQ